MVEFGKKAPICPGQKAANLTSTFPDSAHIAFIQ